MRVIDLFARKMQYYDSIDELSIYAWHKINETNDLTWLLRVKRKVNVHQLQILGTVWEKIIAEFIDTFGIPEKMKEILELKREIFVLQCQMHLEKDLLLKNFIRIAEFKLKELLKADKEQSVGQVKVYVEKYLGFKLNEKVTTVKEFYEYIEVLKSQSKQKGNG